jgi:signal transduction histidine kinase
MMRSLRSRFILSHLLPVLVVIPLFGIGLIYLLETQVLLDELSEDIGDRANLVAAAVNRQPGIWQDPEQAAAFITGMSIFVQGQLYLIGPDGSLLASNDPALNDQNILNLTGIEQALDGESSVLVFYGISRQRGEALIPVTDVNEQLVGIVGITESLQGVATEFGQLRWLIILALLVESILAIIIALILAQRLVRPITVVTEAVTEIADGYRVDPIPEEGADEIKGLAISVNVLVGRLRVLEDARRRLLANLVHEIGRPLGAIRAAIHTLRSGAAEDPEIREELLAGIEDEVKRMQPLLDDLAQLHGQVLGTLELNREPVALSEWLPPLLLPWRAAALEKGLLWQASTPLDLPTINIDPARMAQVVGNLMSNAIKYTPSGGSIDVVASSDDDSFYFSVVDNGPGIVLEEQEKVFEPFYRSTRERRFPQGLGLGLTIALDLVEAHDGQLSIESEPGTGSRFIVRLPLT